MEKKVAARPSVWQPPNLKKVGTSNGSNDNYEGSKVIEQNTLLSKVFYYIIPIYKITQK